MRPRTICKASVAVLLCAAALGTPALAHAAGYTTSTTTGSPLLAATVDTGNHCDDCVTTIALPFPVEIYGTSYTSAGVSSNGNIQFGGTTADLGAACLPRPGFTAPTLFPYQDDLSTTNTGYGIFSAIAGSAPNRQFVLYWHTQYFGRTGTADFEAVFKENSGTVSVIYGATADNGASEVSGIQQSAAGPATQFSCAPAATLVSGLRVNYNALQPFARTAAASNVSPFGARLNGEVNPDGSSTSYAFQWGTTTGYGNTTPVGSAGSGGVNVPAQADLTGLAPNTTYHFRLTATNSSGTSVGADLTFATIDNHGYAITRANGVSLIPGTALVPGSQADDATTPVTFPFTVNFYGAPFTTAYLDTNGTIEFTGSPASDNHPSCLPHSPPAGTLFAYHADLLMNADSDVNYGIYSATTGTGPNRQFVLEWRSGYFAFPGTADFEVIFYENNLSRISVVYGPTADNGSAETAGVQKAVVGPLTQYSCATSFRPLSEGLRLDYTFGLQEAPAATTQAATGVSGSAGTVNGSVNPNGYATSVQFQYGLTAGYGSVTASQALAPDTAAVGLSAALGGLAPGTTYHYRVTATNPNGTTSGDDLTFTTTAPPPPPPPPPITPLKCVVPNVVGKTLAKAKTGITRAHCKLGKVTSKASTQKQKGHVLGQSPKAGKKLKSGAKINLTVGKGPKKKK